MRVVRALDRGCRLINLLVEREDPVTLQEISEALGIPRSTTYELVYTLAQHGFVETVDADQGRNSMVSLGLRLFEAGGAYANRVSFIDEAQKVAEDAAAELQEVVQVAVLDGDHVVWVARAESPGASGVRIVSSVGGREPVHVSGLGKCLLAALPIHDARRRLGDGPLERFTPNTIQDVDEFLQQLESVRRDGYAVDDEESLVGVRCVAVPVRSADGVTTAALSTSAPIFRLAKKQVPEVSRVLGRYRDVLEQKMATDRLPAVSGSRKSQSS
jgi:IclR family transcriptional regulator, KDG regulon repressor